MNKKILIATIFAVGSVFLFLSIMALGNKQIQIGEDFYGFSANGIDHYSFCISQASPRVILSDNDSKMEYSTINDKTSVRVTSNSYSISLSNPVSNTGSMTPSIPDSSKLILLDVQGDTLFDYQVGDIACFWETNQIGLQICHRIIEVRDTQIRTKGDNSISDDGLINKKNVVSVSVGVLF